MNFDEAKGKAQNIFGKMEEAVGEAIGSENLSNAGAEDRVKGAATETWGNAKDTVDTAHDSATAQVRDTRDSAAYEAGRAQGHVETGHASLRDRIVNGAENLKDNVNAKIDNFKAEHEAKHERL